METQNKTSVEIIQELIAIHTTRKEAVDKLKEKLVKGNAAGKLPVIKQQSEQFISELMNELSNFGDAVQGDANRENEYQVMWKNTLPNIDTLSQQECEQTMEKSEQILKKIYQNIPDPASELPASFMEILNSQERKL